MLALVKEDPERASRLRAQRARLRNIRYESSLDEAGREHLRAMKREWWTRVGSERRRRAQT